MLQGQVLRLFYFSQTEENLTVNAQIWEGLVCHFTRQNNAYRMHTGRASWGFKHPTRVRVTFKCQIEEILTTK